MRLPLSLLLAPLAAALLAGPAAAAEPAPPPGWEAPPPLAAPGAKKRGMPAGCAADKLCTLRQLANDATPPDLVARLVEVRFADLPQLVVREAPAGGPPIAGAPGVRIVAGSTPAPWSFVPTANVTARPLGAFGDITWGGGESWLSERMAFARGPLPDSANLGAIHTVPQGTTDVRAILAGKIAYTTIDEGPGGTITVDYVNGELVGTPEPAVSYWGHADAATVVERYLHAFRGRAPSADDPTPGERGAVTFVMPPVFIGFEAKDVKHFGAFRRVGHTVVCDAYTSFTLPAGPGGSGVAIFQLRASEIPFWFPQPKGAEKPPEVMRIALSSSQTSAEPAPRVRVMFFVRDPAAPRPTGFLP